MNLLMPINAPKSFLLLMCFAVSLPAPILSAQSSDSLIQNGSFSDWQNAKPVGWTVDVGAYTDSKTPASKISKVDGGGVQLSGDASTKGWRMLSQRVKVSPGDTLQLNFDAKADGLKREGKQFDNCYVGVFLRNASGKPVATKISPIVTSEYVQDWQIFRVPDKVAFADVIVFLSKTGRLSVRTVSLQSLPPNDSFDILAKDMDRHYSYFQLKDIDWIELVDKYREDAKSAGDTDAFVKVIVQMLGELDDIHTWVIHKGNRISTHFSRFRPNFDFGKIDSQLVSKKKVGNFGLVGKTAQGFGYVRITGLAGIQQNQIQKMMAEVASLFDAPGMVVDLRSNGGGAELVAQAIAGMFTDQRQVYAKQEYRSGPQHSDLVESGTRIISPAKGKVYTRPMVCLIGPGAVSSAEGFAMMMKSLPHCTLIGLPTRGASGNPAPVELPNGVDVFYSRWVSLMPDGTPIEGVGVQPDVVVEHKAGGDPAFDRAITILSRESGHSN